MDERPNKKDKRKKKAKLRDSPPPRHSPPPSLRPYTIPKTGSKELFASIELESREGREIIKNITNTLWDANSINLDITKLELVQNTALQSEYAAKRKEMREQNRSSAETADSFGFLFYRNIAECKKACSTGIERKMQYLPSGASCCIGDRKYGVYLCRCADILKRTPLWNTNSDSIMLICKYMKGRLKPVVEQVSHGAASVEPSPDFDGHTSKNFQRGKKWAHDKIYNTSQIYLYEIDFDNFNEDDDSAIYAKRPRHCLPYAIAMFRAKQKPQQQVISKPTYKKNQAPPIPNPSAVLAERITENINIPEIDYEGLCQQRIQFLWSGFYYNNDTQLAQIQIGAHCPQRIKLPIEGPHLCITQKISVEKLSKIFPQKIFRKPPLLSGASLVSVDNVKFLHAEIHPVTVTSAKIDKLHKHWLKTQKVGVCTLGSGLKLFIIPTGPFTDKLGITCPGYPSVLHCIFMRQFLDSACKFDKDDEEYAEFKKSVNNHVRDRLGHNEELKNQSSNVTLSTKLFGHSTSERLKVLTAFSNVRKAFSGNKNRSRNVDQSKLNTDIPTQTKTPATTTPTTTTSGTGLSDPRLAINKISTNTTSSSTTVQLMTSPTVDSSHALDTSHVTNNTNDDLLSKTTTSNIQSANDNSLPVVTTVQPNNVPPIITKTTQSTTFSIPPSNNNISSQSPLLSSTDLSSTSVNSNATQPSMFDQLLSSPSVKLLKQTNPKAFESIMAQMVSTESSNPPTEPAKASIESSTVKDKVSDTTDSTLLLHEDMDLDSSQEESNPSIIKPQTIDHSSKTTAANITEYSTATTTVVSSAASTKNIGSNRMSYRHVQQNLYRKSVASSLLSMLTLSDVTYGQEQQMVKQQQQEKKSEETFKRHSSRDRDRDRDGDRDRDRDRKNRERDRNDPRGNKERSRSRERVSSRDKEKSRHDHNSSSSRRESPSYRKRSQERRSERSSDNKRSEEHRSTHKESHDKEPRREALQDKALAEKLQKKFVDLENLLSSDKHISGDNKVPTSRGDNEDNAEKNITTESVIMTGKAVNHRQADDVAVNSLSEKDIPFLETSQEESEDNLIIDTDTQPSSQIASDYAPSSTKKIPVKIRKDIDETKTGKTLQDISDAFYDESSLEKTVLSSSSSSLLSPTNALDALKGEMRKQATDVLLKRQFGKDGSFQDVSSESSDLGNIETSINNQRMLNSSREKIAFNTLSPDTSTEYASYHHSDVLNSSTDPSNRSVDTAKEIENRHYSSTTDNSPVKQVSQQQTVPSHDVSQRRSSPSQSRNTSHTNRSRSKERSRSRDRYGSSSKRRRSRSKERSSGKRRYSPSKQHQESPREVNGYNRISGRSNSPLLKPGADNNNQTKKDDKGDKTAEPKETTERGQAPRNRTASPTAPPKSKFQKTSQSGSKSTGYEDPKHTMPRVPTWKEATMRRTEEKRRKTYSSSSEDENNDTKKETRKKPITSSNKKSGSKETLQNPNVVKPRLSDIESSSDFEDDLAKSLPIVKRYIARMVTEEEISEPVVDFRTLRQHKDNDKSVEPVLPKQKKKQTSKPKTTPSSNTVCKPKLISPSDRSQTPPLELLMFKEAQAMVVSENVDSTSALSNLSPVAKTDPVVSSPKILPVVSYHVTCTEGLFPQVVTQTGFNSHAGISGAHSELPSLTPGGLTPSYTTASPTDSSLVKPTAGVSIDRGMTSALSPISSSESCDMTTIKARSLKEWTSKLPHSELDDFCANLIKNVTEVLE